MVLCLAVIPFLVTPSVRFSAALGWVPLTHSNKKSADILKYGFTQTIQ